MSERESTYKAEAWRMTGYYPNVENAECVEVQNG